MTNPAAFVPVGWGNYFANILCEEYCCYTCTSPLLAKQMFVQLQKVLDIKCDHALTSKTLQCMFSEKPKRVLCRLLTG